MYLDKENKNKSITHGPYDQVCGWRENIMTCPFHSLPSHQTFQICIEIHIDMWIKRDKQVKVRLKSKIQGKCYGAS